MGKTGIISRGFAKTAWDSLSAREIEYSRAVSRELVELANHCLLTEPLEQVKTASCQSVFVGNDNHSDISFEDSFQ